MSRYVKTVPSTSMQDVHSLPIMPTIKEFAPIMNMSAKNLADLCNEGILPAVKIGGTWRIKRDQALAMLGFEV